MQNSQRSNQKELIDLGPTFYSDQEYIDCLKKLDLIGRVLGGDWATLSAFANRDSYDTILDVGCGGGQFTKRLAEKYPLAKVTGIDISEKAIAFAKESLDPSISNIHFEVPASSQLDYPDNSFDVVTSTLVCHHLTDEMLIDFLKRSYRIAKKTIIINDLHRHIVSEIGFIILSKIFFRNRLIMHDGPLSIRRAFTRNDWKAYLKAADIPTSQYKISWHWAFRWIVVIRTENKN